MYTSYIGTQFLKLYKEIEKKPVEYKAKEFFDEVFFPLFFMDDSHLMHVGNSPFFQKPTAEAVKTYGSKSLAQLSNLRKKISEGLPSGAIYVGYGAEDLQATSSGQLTNIEFNINEEEIYLSWIGQALGIGVSGGFVMLINERQVLLDLFEGWKYYRKYLEQTPKVKDKQIETWNGQWLSHAFSGDYNKERPFDNFNIETVESLGNIAIPTRAWVNLVFTLNKKYKNKIMAYAYNLSQTNTTLGFITIYLSDISYLFELKDKLFLNRKESILQRNEIEQLETFFNFKVACKFGTIGLRALEPKGLREFMPKGSIDYAQGKDFKFTTENSYHIYQLYKIWIIAMLNKTELLNIASKIADALVELEKKDERAKKVFATLSQEVRDSKNLKGFIEKLTEVLEIIPSNGESFREVVDQVLKMPSDHFPLFVTLIRFEFIYKQSIKIKL